LDRARRHCERRAAGSGAGAARAQAARQEAGRDLNAGSEQPIALPRRGGAFAAVPGVWKESPEDFVVEEVPAYEPCGAGDHLWLWLEKRGIGTVEAIARLARALGRREREFGYAGLKDAQAVTRQWLSIEHLDPALVQQLELPGLRVLRVARHQNKLRKGHLHGNRFDLIVRQVPDGGAALLAAHLAHCAQHGAPNWFGMQRFGSGGRNLAKGLAVLRDPARAARRMPRAVLSLVVSSVQSEVFNRVLAARLATIDRLLPGDLAILHRNGAVFPVADPAAEQPRCDSFELSPSGPLPGPAMPWPTGEPLQLEQRALASLALDPEAFGRMPRDSHEGTRRALRMRVLDPAAEQVEGGVRLRFRLDRGCYATAVLSELLGG
jgi:tRNA pseudouridine13 synthase